MSIESYYDTTFKVVTRTFPADHSTVAMTESCSTAVGALNPTGGTVFQAGGKVFDDADYKLFCSATVAIEDKNLILVGSVRYGVEHVKDTFGMGHHKRVLLKRNVV